MNIITLEKSTLVESALFGNKAVGLSKLLQGGFDIPETHILKIDTEITDEDIMFIFSLYQKVIVRSSSFLEDSKENSYAGAFISLISTRDTIKNDVNTIRKQAMEVQTLFKQKLDKIALIIQPLVEGIGGVYLYDKTARKEVLDLSIFGVDSVTSGQSSSFDLLKSNSPEYIFALEECRKIASFFSISIDLEFIFDKDKILFLQYRQLTSSISHPEIYSRNDYFPTPVKPLCGTLWADILSKALNCSAIYKNSDVVVDIPVDYNFTNINIKNKDFEQAIDYYNDFLFPKWQERINLLEKKEFLDETQYFLFALNEWQTFINEYFNNEFEHIIDYARYNAPIGASRSPYFCQWLNSLNDLSALANTLPNISNQPKYKLFIEKYGKSFIQSNYFNMPSLIENQAQFVEMLKNMKSDYTHIEPPINPISTIKAAWLAEDDNEYKDLFAFYLRKSILKLASSFKERQFISKEDDIWEIEIDELLSAIQKNEKPKLSKASFKKDIISNDKETVFDGEILSFGNVSGKVFCDPQEVSEDKIFVKSHLNNWDYPTLLKCKGAVVSFGTLNAHFAIFARDFNKPIFKSYEAVSNLKNGHNVILDSDKKTITLKL